MASKVVPGMTKRIPSIPSETLNFLTQEWKEQATGGADEATQEQMATFFKLAFRSWTDNKAKTFSKDVLKDFSKGGNKLDKDGFTLFLASSWAVNSIEVCEMEQGFLNLPEEIKTEIKEEFMELLDANEVEYLGKKHLTAYFSSINRHWSEAEAKDFAVGVLTDFSDGESMDEQGFVLYYRALWATGPKEARKQLKRVSEAREGRNEKNKEEIERRRAEKKRLDKEKAEKKRRAEVVALRKKYSEEEREDYEDALDVYEETGKGDIQDIQKGLKNAVAKIRREADVEKIYDDSSWDPEALKMEAATIKEYIQKGEMSLSDLKAKLKRAEKKAEAKALREAMGLSDAEDSDDDALMMTEAEAEAKYKADKRAEERKMKEMAKKFKNDSAALAKLKAEQVEKQAELERKRGERKAVIQKAKKLREERIKQMAEEKKRREEDRKRAKEEAKRKKKEERERKQKEREERKRLAEIAKREARARERREEERRRKQKEIDRREEAKRRKELLKKQRKAEKEAQKQFEKKIKARRAEKKKMEAKLKVAKEEAERKRRIAERARMACQITISEAGAFNVNMGYDKKGEYNGKPYWSGKSRISGERIEVFWSKEDWRIMRLKPPTVYYVHADDTEKPPSAGWKPMDGEYAPVPKLEGDTNDPIEPVELDDVSAELLLVRDIMSIWDDNENWMLELDEIIKMWWMLDGVKITEKIYQDWCAELNEKFEADDALMKDKTQKVYPVEPQRGLSDRQVLELYSHLGRNLEHDYELAQREEGEREFANKVVLIFRAFDEDYDEQWGYHEWARFMWMCHGIEYPEEKYTQILRLLKVPQLDLAALNRLYFEHIPEQLHDNYKDVVLRPTVSTETKQTLGDVVQAFTRLDNSIVEKILSFIKHSDYLLYHEVGVRHEIIVYDENTDMLIKEYFKPVPWIGHNIRADNTLAVATREYDKSRGEDVGWREYYCIYTSDPDESSNFLSKIKSLEPFTKVYPDDPDTLIEIFPDVVFLEPTLGKNVLVFVSFMHADGLLVNRINYSNGAIERSTVQNNINAEAGRLILSNDKQSLFFLYQVPYCPELYIGRVAFGETEFQAITEIQWFPELYLDNFVAACLSPDEKTIFGCVQINMIYHLLRIDVQTGEILARNAIGYGMTKTRPPASKGLPKILVESLFYSTDGYVVVVMNHEGRIAYFMPNTLKEERFRSVDFPPSENPVDISLMTARELNLEYFSIRNPIGHGFS